MNPSVEDISPQPLVRTGGELGDGVAVMFNMQKKGFSVEFVDGGMIFTKGKITAFYKDSGELVFGKKDNMMDISTSVTELAPDCSGYPKCENSSE